MGKQPPQPEGGSGSGGAGGGREGPAGLAREIYKRGAFDSPAQEAFLNLMRTGGVLGGAFERLFKRHGLSSATYNALRILRGAGERGRRCSEVGEHLVAAVPDVTRLIDRLEKAGLARRSRGGEDRRVVLVRITASGRALLRRLDRPVLELHEAQLGHLSRRELEQLSTLLCRARERVRWDEDCEAR
ncbi:MAG: MarR family transcriptional regulator [Phycisphaerales bacterium]|nr:MarR family transcriptional regulator [Phycisphaerales bacterium]